MVRKFYAPISAVQWTGDNIDEVRPFVGNFDFNDAEPGQLFVEVETEDEWLKVNIGDWILSSAFMEQYELLYGIIPDEAFQEVLSKGAWIEGEKEAETYYEASKIGSNRAVFEKGGGVVIPKDTTIPQRSTCGVPYAPPRTIHLPKEICKKIISGKMVKLIENFPRLPLDYGLVVEGEEAPFATIQVLSSERFPLISRVSRLKVQLGRVRDSIEGVELMFSDDVYFCLSCGFDSIEDFVKRYEKAPACSHYLHTINLLNTY